MNDDTKKTVIEEPPIDNPEDESFYTELPVGEILKKTREKYNKTIPEISTTLRIRSSLVEAIEEGDIEKLPGRVYAIGFVRSYAEYLSLDADKIVELFKIQHVGRRKKPEYIFPVSADESRVPGKIILWLCVILILGIVFYKSSQNLSLPTKADPINEVVKTEKPKKADNSIPEVPKDLLKDIKLPEKLELPKKSEKKPTAADSHIYKDPLLGHLGGFTDEYLTPVGTIEPHDKIKRTPKIRPESTPAEEVKETKVEIEIESEAVKPVFNDDRIRITGIENSWMEIKDLGGRKVFSRVLKKSETYTLPDKSGLILSTSNAGGLEIRVGDRVLPSLGEKSQIRKNINVDDLAEQ